MSETVDMVRVRIYRGCEVTHDGPGRYSVTVADLIERLQELPSDRELAVDLFRRVDDGLGLNSVAPQGSAPLRLSHHASGGEAAWFDAWGRGRL